MNIIKKATDAIGLTDHAGAEAARNHANRALSYQLGASKELIDWWKTNSAPYQIGLMEKGLSLYDDTALTDADYARELGLVSGDVARAFGRARDATRMEMLRYGMDPSSGRFASMLTTSGNQQAAAEAAARNAARRGLRDTEFARKSSALGLASGLNTPNYGLVGTGMGGLSTAAGQYGSMANTMDASNRAAIGALLQGAGAAYGGYLAKGADGGAKTKRGFKNRYANGREVREKFMGDAERVDTPMGLSQIRGEMRGPGTPVSDDIPVMTEDGGEARLADGEVVMPTDTVAKLGLSIYRANPEAAMHKLGVAALEEIIDETHVPAEVQREQGLSVDPRGVEDDDDDDYADGKQVKRPPLGTGMAEGAAKAIEERKRRMAKAMEGYADGGQSGLGLGLSMLGHGLANAYSRGGWLEGVQAGRRAANQEEEAEFMRGQRERLLAEQARADKERQRREAYEAALGVGLDYAKANPDKTTAAEQIGLATEAYSPAMRIAQMAEDEKAKAEREFKERELRLKYGDQYAMSDGWIYNKRTGKREWVGKGAGAGWLGGWKPEDIDKQAFSMAARALGIDNMANMTPADEARVAKTAAAIRNEFMLNPEAGINNAYERFISTREDPALREAAMAAATEEASARNPFGPDAWRPDAMRRAYGGLTEQEWIERRAQEIYDQRRGLAPAAPQQDPLLAAMQARRQSRAMPKQTANAPKAVPKPTKGDISRLARSSAMDAFNDAVRAVRNVNITPSMARAQLKRLEGIEEKIDRNMRWELRKLREQLRRVAGQGDVGLSEVRG